MWRKLLGVPPPATIAIIPEAATDYGRTIGRMALTDDMEERRKLGHLAVAQLEAAFGRQADNTQVTLWSIEQEWRAKLQDQLGATNEMISAVLESTRRQEVAAATLQTAFRALGERLGERLAAHETRLAQAEGTLDQLNAALTVSLAERREIRATLAQLMRVGDQLIQLQHDMDALSARDARQYAESAKDRADARARLDRIEAALAARGADAEHGG